MRLVIWFSYLFAAFAATHTPKADRVLVPSFLSDLAMHFAGYAVLGGLTMWMLSPARRMPLRLMGASCLGLMAYAAFDELTQPLVGRACELGDWVADVLGALAGILVAGALLRGPVIESSQAGPTPKEFRAKPGPIRE
jgi:VanZ family protein